MNKQTILVIDDDARLRSLLSDYLSDQGFFVAVAANASEAEEKLAWLDFDALVLDRMMPGKTGLELAQSLKKAGLRTPILMLTAMGEASDRIEGLEAGVEDYLTKPFEPRELVLRINNLLGRKPVMGECRFGGYRYDLQQEQLYSEDGTMIRLTSAEAAYLSLLASSQNTPVSREALAACAGQSESRAVDVTINRLRKKIEAEPSKPIYLQTVRGAGYVLK